MIDLKPCPFCGGAVEMYVDGLPENGEAQLQFAQCEQCGALGPTDEDYDFAAHLWNTRPDSLALTAAVQAEREACARIADVHRGCHAPKVINFDLGADLTGRGIAAAIRSRGPAPAVDVMAVVREYVEAYDDYQEAINFKKTCRNDESVTVAADRRIKAGLALRALVDGKGEGKENER